MENHASEGMMRWIDGHSPAIQALSAVVSAVLTFFIMRLTSRYVDLTQSIASSAKTQAEIARLQVEAAKRMEAAATSQLEIEKRHQQAAEREFRGIVNRILAQVAASPTVSRPEPFLRRSVSLSDQDIDSLRAAAKAAAIDKPDELEGALSALDAFAHFQEQVKQSDSGYTLPYEELSVYRNHLRNLREGLKKFTAFRPNEE